MSVYRCQPLTRPLDAVITLPGSKSITNRALICAALADGSSILRNVLLADDTRLMMDALRALGIAITVDEKKPVAEVTGCRGFMPSEDAFLSCGNSGTTLRFCTALAALGNGQFTLDGVARMRERPIGDLVEALQGLGAGIEYMNREGYPPIVVHAQGLRGGQVVLESPASSQFVSALFLSSPYASRDVKIELRGEVPSIPYLRTTLAVMEEFGVSVLHESHERESRFIVAAPQRYQGTTYTIEPDASNATYFLAAAAIAGGRVTVEGLGTYSIQGDAKFTRVLEQMSCRVGQMGTSTTVTGPPDGARLRGIDIDLNDMPDTVQTLAVVALFADSPTTIRNVASLRVKETDRIAALREELSRLGAKVDEFTDGLRIFPPIRGVVPAKIRTYEDHRMAMSFALAGLMIPGIEIENPECCGKTMPDYFERFERLETRPS
ncbi:MAG: 3-phosphoshikimate 1-carboxyvinyltransferase [Planctomycetes bacterium]|nr:3-phosphoshikimate 1-carboxyvinyltransferase [Planctomycetota bacterium]MBI3834888.1 3-phosphoshikimate 1-carboxyvinyltransferase [Planctomycetota bacterium]